MFPVAGADRAAGDWHNCISQRVSSWALRAARGSRESFFRTWREGKGEGVLYLHSSCLVVCRLLFWATYRGGGEIHVVTPYLVGRKCWMFSHAALLYRYESTVVHQLSSFLTLCFFWRGSSFSLPELRIRTKSFHCSRPRLTLLPDTFLPRTDRCLQGIFGFLQERRMW
jgi:hypothetical protein